MRTDEGASGGARRHLGWLDRLRLMGHEIEKPLPKALQRAGVVSGTQLLDIGCGAGVALQMARDMGAIVSGVDSSKALVRIARQRLPKARVVIGDMMHLPFADDSFDVVTGLNAFQFAGSLTEALVEARRVCRAGGSVFMLVWGPQEHCELQHISLRPLLALRGSAISAQVSPLGRSQIESAMLQASLKPTDHGEISAALTFPNATIAMRAFLSAGPMQCLLAEFGEEVVSQTLAATLIKVTEPDGRVTWNNQFIWIKAQRLFRKL